MIRQLAQAEDPTLSFIVALLHLGNRVMRLSIVTGCGNNPLPLWALVHGRSPPARAAEAWTRRNGGDPHAHAPKRGSLSSIPRRLQPTAQARPGHVQGFDPDPSSWANQALDSKPVGTTKWPKTSRGGGRSVDRLVSQDHWPGRRPEKSSQASPSRHQGLWDGHLNRNSSVREP